MYHFLKVDGATELHDEGMDAPRRPNPGGWTYEIFTRKSLSSSTVEIKAKALPWGRDKNERIMMHCVTYTSKGLDAPRRPDPVGWTYKISNATDAQSFLAFIRNEDDAITCRNAWLL